MRITSLPHVPRIEVATPELNPLGVAEGDVISFGTDPWQWKVVSITDDKYVFDSVDHNLKPGDRVTISSTFSHLKQ